MVETVSVFVPLLFLVVTELSSIAREMNLKNAVNRDRRPLVLGFAPQFVDGLNKHIGIPKIGHFNFIHGANFVLLSLGMLMVVFLSSGVIRYILATMIWIVWVLLPIFEVDEYEYILDVDNRKPFSFIAHVSLTTICAGFVAYGVVYMDFQSLTENTFAGVDMFNWMFYVFCFLAFVSNYFFLSCLEKEIKGIPDEDVNS
jgi:hypothetical protein